MINTAVNDVVTSNAAMTYEAVEYYTQPRIDKLSVKFGFFFLVH